MNRYQVLQWLLIVTAIYIAYRAVKHELQSDKRRITPVKVIENESIATVLRKATEESREWKNQDANEVITTDDVVRSIKMRH